MSLQVQGEHLSRTDAYSFGLQTEFLLLAIINKNIDLSCREWYMSWPLLPCPGSTDMFTLTVIADSVRIHPKHSQSRLLDSVTEVLNGRFCNRVITGVGLCIRVFDVLEMEDPIVHSGESHSTVKGKESYIVDSNSAYLFSLSLCSALPSNCI